MGQRFLIDTNVVCDCFTRILPPAAHAFTGDIFDEISELSVISQIELLVWNTVPPIRQAIEEFIAESVIYNLTPAVVAFAVDVRKRSRLKLPDAIIAATALSRNAILVTRNNSDFGRVSGLQLINPWEL